MISGSETESEKDVIFVSEKCAPTKSNEITVDQAKRLVLQRDIDQQSQPRQLVKALTSRAVAVERPVEKVKMKIEEEKNEQNCEKKMKRMKGQASLPVKKKVTLDDGSQAGLKREKKGKQVDVIVMDVDDESLDGGGEKTEKTKKKRKCVPESLNDAKCSDVKNGHDTEVIKKKKKKKQLETPQSSPVKQVEKKHGKVMKVKNKSAQATPQKQEEEEEEEEKQGGNDKLPKKAKKRKNVVVVSKEESDEPVKAKKKKKTIDQETEAEEGLRVTKKKNAAKKKLAENGVKSEIPDEDNCGVEEVTVKKKKRKTTDQETEAEDLICVTKKKNTAKKKVAENVICVTKKKNAAKKKVAENGVKSEIPDEENCGVEEVTVKKKKKKTTNQETEAEDLICVTKKKNTAKKKVAENGVKSEIPDEEAGEIKEANTKEKGNKTLKIKGNGKAASGVKEAKDNMPKKKKNKSAQSEIVIEEEGTTELKKNGKKEKGRKASVEVSIVEETEPKRKKSSSQAETPVTAVSLGAGTKKKKKIKEEVKEPHEFHPVDVIFLSEKSGNTDEVNINQERRQALQMEIDKASQPQKTDMPTGLGQWSTAQFDSSDQQHKFLRLMGGLKKGSQPAARSSGGANMALGKDREQELQQGLLGEFERAQSRRMDFSNRGSGLGFTAPAKQKFSIDINSRHSVRFED